MPELTRVESMYEMVERMAKDVGGDFTEPDDDWFPVAHVLTKKGERFVLAIDLDFMQNEATKGRLVKNLTDFIRKKKVTHFTLVLSTWIVKADRKPGIDLDTQAEEVGLPSQHPDREEMLLVTSFDADTFITGFALIERHDDAPPTLGEFERMPDDAMSGRFIEPFRDALKAARR